jgi:hypothetical protein
MRRQDFLHKDVETTLCEHYIAAGAVCSLSTNSEQVLKAARNTFLPLETPPAAVDFSMRFWVDGNDEARLPWPKPYVRGLDHMVFAGLDPRSSLLANLRTRRVLGRFSAAMAADTSHWKTIIFPILLSIVAGSVGLVELHASCVAKDQLGLILLGPSQSGKSTLAMAFTEAGFQLLSDDRTFCSLTHGQLQAWGLPRPLKLRREAASWFDDFRGHEPTDVQNGERVFHFEPKLKSAAKCNPQLLVFLERQEQCGFSVIPIKRNDARSRIEKNLMAEAPEAIRKQAGCIDELLFLPCCLLRYGGQPQVIADQLATFFLDRTESQRPECQSSAGARWRAS